MSQKPIIQHLVDDVNNVIDKYRDEGITVGEVVGVFQLAILDIWAEWAMKMKGGDDLPSGSPDIFPEEDL